MRAIVPLGLLLAACGSKTPLGDDATPGANAKTTTPRCTYSSDVGTDSVRNDNWCVAMATILAYSASDPSTRSTGTEYCPTNDPDPAACVASIRPDAPTSYTCQHLCGADEYAVVCAPRSDVPTRVPEGCRSVSAGEYCCPCL